MQCKEYLKSTMQALQATIEKFSSFCQATMKQYSLRAPKSEGTRL